MEVVRKLQDVLIDINDRPRVPIVIINCGEVDDPRDYLRLDPFRKEEMDKKNLQKILD